jgi:tight adherence protein B
MGAIIGLAFGVGVLLLMPRGPAARSKQRERCADLSVTQRVADLLAQAGYDGVRPHQLYAGCVACGWIGFILAAGISQAVTIGLVFGAVASYAPIALVRRRHRLRQIELRDLWPDVVDNLASAVRAGMSLADALEQVSVRGPAPLRPAFAAFAADYRATGRFGDSLDCLKQTLADPVGDRIVESVRLAREVGGSDLGRLLRTLSGFLRDDARTRAELETRQGWTVSAARLALAAPWIVLAMLSLRPETVAAYDSSAGALVLLIGGGVSVAAYRLMLRIAALPVEPRVLR